ncbi:MAG: M67 family metallopeptidase [Pseudomonadota bacterium]
MSRSVMRADHTQSDGDIPTLIQLPLALAEQIAAHSCDDFPREACGLLIGTATGTHVGVHSIAACDNVAEDPSKSFEIAPADLLTAHREARAQGLAVIGHYHSHPNGLTRPSSTDSASIADPAAVWLIQAMDGNGGALSLHAFVPQPNTDGFMPLALEVDAP